jgi:indole-3-glycerol phosphate synthase
MFGINNRNLRTFGVALETTVELMKEIKEDTLIITESGILSANDVAFIVVILLGYAPQPKHPY